MRRTPLMVIGVVLAVLGVAALIWQKISYTQRETVVNVGPVNVSADTTKSVPLSPILGGIMLASGAVLIVLGVIKTRGQA